MSDYDKNNAVNLVFDILQKEYEAEEERNKHLETKAQMMLALAGIVTSAIMLLLKIVIEIKHYIVLIAIVTLISFTISLIGYAIYLLLGTLKIRKFQRIDDDILINLDIRNLKEEDIKFELIQDYKKGINASNEILENKVNAIKYGSNILEVAIIIFVMSYLVILFNVYTERKDIMANDKSDKNGSVNNQGKEDNTRNGNIGHFNYETGKGFGTKPVEKSDSTKEK